jgi:hypothetical protein
LPHVPLRNRVVVEGREIPVLNQLMDARVLDHLVEAELNPIRAKRRRRQPQNPLWLNHVMQVGHRRCRIVLAIVNQDAVGKEVVVSGDSDVVGLDDSSRAADSDNRPSDQSSGMYRPNLYHRDSIT